MIKAVRDALPEADITIGPGIEPAMHLRGPCVLALAKRDFSYQPRHSIEMGVRDWFEEEANYEAQ